jgi:hypothetical protein
MPGVAHALTMTFSMRKPKQIKRQTLALASFVAALTMGCTTGAQIDAIAPAPTREIAALDTEALSDAEAKEALDAYVRINREELVRLAANNPMAAAFIAVLDRVKDGPDRVIEAARSMAAGDPRNRLVDIAADQMIAQYRWQDAMDAARELHSESGIIPFAKPYAKWPEAGVNYAGQNIFEVPFDGLRMPAKIGGEDIEIAFDTGAPSVGVDRRFAKYVEMDRSVPQNFAYPAFNVRLTRYQAVIGELEIGGVKLTNVPATIGGEVAENQREAVAEMERIVGRYDIIMGLDALRPIFDVVEFDYDRDVVRLIREDDQPASIANMIMGGGRKPIIRAATQNRESGLYIDTGSYGHLFGEGAFEIPDCLARRVMMAPWREITEHRVNLALVGGNAVQVWAQPRSLVDEPEWDTKGYIGNPRDGVYRLDLEDGNFQFRDYDSDNLDSLYPIIDEKPGTCSPAGVASEAQGIEPTGALVPSPPDRTRSARQPRTNSAAVATEYRNGLWWSERDGVQTFASGTRYAVDGVFVMERPPGPLRIVDFNGAHIIPPLADAHDHRLEGPWAFPMMVDLLEAGVFYYKNPSSFGPVVRQHLGLFNRPDAIDATWSHGSLTTAGSHPVPLYARLANLYRTNPEEMDGKAYFLISDTDQLDARWPEVLSGRPDFIKVLFVNRGGTSDLTGTPPEVAARTVQLAHTAGIHVTAHVVTAVDLAAAIDAKVDEVTHLPGWTWQNIPRAQNVITPELAARMAKAGISLVTTAGIAASEDWEDPDWKLSPLQQLQGQNLRQLIRAGVAVHIGTDGVLSPRMEVEYLRRLQVMDDREWLLAWMRTGPNAIFPERAIGRLAPGYEANFIALACNPVGTFECVDRITHREKQGQELMIVRDVQ